MIVSPPYEEMGIRGKNESYTANLPTKIQDFRGLDSSSILSLRGAILTTLGDVTEDLSQQILVGIILVT